MEITRSLQSARPDLAEEWHPTKNGEWVPTQVAPQSNKDAWWLGKCGHEWKAKITNRFHGAGCPFCSGRYTIVGENDLATTNPELAKQWHSEKNGNLTPCDVKEYSNKKVWWKCNEGHEWQAVIGSRKNRGCPYCSGNKVLEGFNDIKTLFPELIKEWHPEKNSIKPEMISRGYDKKVWWLCEFGHEWAAPVYNRIKGSGCPYCSKGQKTSFSEQAVFFYVRKVFPDAISREVKNGVEFDVFIPSINVAIEYDGYKWHSDERAFKKDSIKNKICYEKGIMLFRLREEGAPELVLNPNVLLIPSKYADIKRLEEAIKNLLFSLGKEDLDININRDRINILEQYATARKGKSLAFNNPTLSEEWHPTLNGRLTPENVNAGSVTKVWWLGKCGHKWEASIYNRVKGEQCPFCNSQKVLAGFNDLRSHCPDIAKEWHPYKNGKLTPEDVLPSSNKKVWWMCKKGHEWVAVIGSRKKNGCPYCSNKAVLEGYNDLGTLFPNIAKEWNSNKNGSLRPQMFTKGSNKKVWWKCSLGHEWEASIHSRTNGRGCPKCGRITAKKKLGKRVQNVDTGVIYDTTSEAAMSCGGDGANIAACCKGRHKKVYGFRWKYADEES
ncbi:MAG: zinc-ribbon domain-containing protein [Lachnospiraceae bacterium]|nr:zinc-ribbon domain-containing protein [Lachnospiraceae bacterium]